MKLISKGQKTKDEVVQNHLAQTREIYTQLVSMVGHMDRAMSQYFEPLVNTMRDNENAVVTENFTKCGKCGGMTSLVEADATRMNSERAIQCQTCKLSLQTPRKGQLAPHDHTCPLCNFQVILFSLFLSFWFIIVIGSFGYERTGEITLVLLPMVPK
jgi:hypothetical protein